MSGARGRLLMPYILVGLMAVVVHSGSLRGEFLEWDDDLLVTGNPRVIEGGISDIADLLNPAADRAHYGLEYLPLRDLSNRVDRLFFGMNPVGYHLGNVLLFGLAAAMLLGVILALTGDRRVAVIGALLFAVHPITTESVACIAHRKDVLMAALFLAAWLAWLRERRTLTVILFAGAVLSKLPAVVFPGIVILGDLVLMRRLDRRRLLWLAGLVAVSVAGIVTSVKIAPALGEAGWHGGTIGGNALSVGVAFLESCRLLLVPVGLHVGRVNEAMTRTSPDAASLAGLALLVALIAGGLVALVTYRRRPTTGRGVFALTALALVIVQLPYLQIRPFWVLFAERYLILAVVPVCVAAGLLMVRLTPRLRSAAVVVLVPLLTISTVHRETRWCDTETLFKDAIAKSPRSYLALDKLGRMSLLDGRFEEARDLLERAIASTEHYGRLGQAHLDQVAQESRWNLINARLGLGLLDDAEGTATDLRNGWPESWRGPFFLGLVAQSRAMASDGRSRDAKERDLAVAEAHYEKALEIAAADDPEASKMHHNLGLLHHMRDGPGSARALAEHEQAVRLNPEMPQAWVELGKLYEFRSRWGDAAQAWHRAADIIETRPGLEAQAAELRRRARRLERR